MSTTSAQSVLLKYRSNSLAKREKKRKRKEMPPTLMATIEQKPESCMCMHTLTRRQGTDEGKLSLHNERMRKNREEKNNKRKKD